MNDLISVIVPVYNVEAYLPQCMESVLSQEHSALEVILIDDGSTDSSGEICDRFARLDSRVRVIHQSNGGAAAAKNAGLRAATGEYLSFVDSDDFLEPGAYRHMLAVLKETGAQAGEFAFRDVYLTRVEDQILFPGRSVLEGFDYLIQFTKGWTCALLWNKLYRRELFDGIFFEEGHRVDDEYFTYQGFLKPVRVVRDDRIVYNYRRRRSGVMRSQEAAAQVALDRIDALSKRRKLVTTRVPQVRKIFDVEFLEALIYMSCYAEGSRRSILALKGELKSYLSQRGNTFPPRYLWRGLLELYATGVDTLLSRRDDHTDDAPAEECFP